MCPITQNGLLRCVSLPRYTNPASFNELLALLNKATSEESHDFLPDDISLATTGPLSAKVARTSSAVTEVYLLALAVKHAGRW